MFINSSHTLSVIASAGELALRDSTLKPSFLISYSGKESGKSLMGNCLNWGLEKIIRPMKNVTLLGGFVCFCGLFLLGLNKSRPV